jgi:hypothetical protein
MWYNMNKKRPVLTVNKLKPFLDNISKLSSKDKRKSKIISDIIMYGISIDHKRKTIWM